jgi:nucleotide-binding universal stress UspA family protein
MYNHVLIATDGSELAEKAVKAGLMLAKTRGPKATAVTISEPWTSAAGGEAPAGFPFDAYEKAAAQAAKILASASDVAKQLDVTCATVHLKTYPAEGILQAAKERGCDLIVMASHGRRGFTRFLLGSQAMRVLTGSRVPVLVYR